MGAPTIKGRHKHHRHYELPPEQCMECGWAQARCQAKVRYDTHIAANAEATSPKPSRAAPDGSEPSDAGDGG